MTKNRLIEIRNELSLIRELYSSKISEAMKSKDKKMINLLSNLCEGLMMANRGLDNSITYLSKMEES